MRRYWELPLEIALVAAAVLIAAPIAEHVRLIPASLLHLPEITFSAEDTRVDLIALIVACAVAFAANRLLNGGGVFASPRRLAKELYALLIGIVAAALYLFLLTAITFSPELLLDATLIAAALFFVAFVLLGGRAAKALAETFRLLKSPWTWPVLLFALSPLVIARQFTVDRDFANWVTNIRVSANVSNDHPYVLVNALGTTLFETPIDAKFARSDPQHIYVLTRNGKLYRADYPSGANKTLLLDLAAKVGYVEMENGALGFDLHPDFGKPGAPHAGHAYVYYTEYHADRQVNHLTRYDVGSGDPAKALAGAQPLIEQGRNNDGYHNAGSVNFGPDGFLYLSVGEMAMQNCYQRVDCALVGGILRIDVDERGGTVSRAIAKQPQRGKTANYFIPSDNPYASDPAALGEYWATGLRNPFRISFDPANGQLWAGEVGSTTWEEVNRVGKGTNHQFPYIEGFTPQPDFPRPAKVPGIETPPVLTYHHTAYLRSVIGGLVYRGAAYPELRGRYIFGDNYSGEIMAIPASVARTDKWQVIARSADVAQRGLTGFTQAPDGALLVTVMGDNDTPTGTVSRLVPKDSAAAKAAPVAAAAPARPVTEAQATAIYGTSCARCHGAKGLGDGPDAKALGDYVPSFADPNFQRYFSDEAILAVIEKGGPGIGRSPMMPPWEGVLRPNEIVAMKDHVRRLGKKP